MSYASPKPGRYRRIKDGAEVQVFGSTGTSGIDTVAVKATANGSRLTHVRQENFSKKYEPWPARVYVVHDTLTPQNVRGTWDDVLVIPAVGDTFTSPWGYMGATVDWTVTRQEWLNGSAVTLYVTGPAMGPAGEFAECPA